MYIFLNDEIVCDTETHKLLKYEENMHPCIYQMIGGKYITGADVKAVVNIDDRFKWFGVRSRLDFYDEREGDWHKFIKTSAKDVIPYDVTIRFDDFEIDTYKDRIKPTYVRPEECWDMGVRFEGLVRQAKLRYEDKVLDGLFDIYVAEDLGFVIDENAYVKGILRLSSVDKDRVMAVEKFYWTGEKYLDSFRKVQDELNE